SAGAHADRPVVGIGEPDGGHHVLLVVSLDDDVGKAIRHIDIAAGKAPRRFVALLAAPKRLAGEIPRLLRDRVAHVAARRGHNAFDASLAPWTRARSLAHMIEGCTRCTNGPCAKPQSVPAMTLSRPTSR